MIEVRPFSFNDKRFRDMCDRARLPSSEAVAEAEAVIRRTESGDAPAIDIESLRITPEEMDQARRQVSEQFLTALTLARVNLRKFHEYQRRRGYVHDDDDGVRISRIARPLGRVGILCGNSFAVLMACAVPAQVAGVDRIAVAARPGADGAVDPAVLAAARVLGIDEVYRMDGPEAVAVFALGAPPMAKTDKIVGPGDAATEAAKRLLQGLVGVDLGRGVSELAVVADASANARFIAADLLAQAENGGGMLALLTDDRLLAEAVRIEMNRMLELRDSWAAAKTPPRLAGLFVCRSLDEAMDAANLLAPARLLLVTRDNDEYMGDVENAGEVFLGSWSPEAAGDFFAGSNPLLPLAGTSRFASGLGVDDFVKEITVTEYGPDRLLKTGRHILALAERGESPAHAEAIRIRLELLKLAVE